MAVVGATTVLDDARFGLIDNWLRHVGDVKEKYIAENKCSGLKRSL